MNDGHGITSGVSRARESPIGQQMHGAILIIDVPALQMTKGKYFVDLKVVLKELNERGMTPVVVLTKVDLVDGDLLIHPENAQSSELISTLIRDYVIAGTSVQNNIHPCKLYSQELTRSIALEIELLRMTEALIDRCATFVKKKSRGEE